MAKLRAFGEIQYPTLPLYDTANSDRLNSALRALTPRRVPLHVDTLHLLNAGQRRSGEVSWLIT
ncbi:hypothetical protein GCM10010207_84230 [Streptomyces atratus]|nr:hypothetical protein GCM10010207_84230 [Streptomyces atratus]